MSASKTAASLLQTPTISGTSTTTTLATCIQRYPPGVLAGLAEMDIQGWLQGTTDRAPPDPSDGLPIDASAFIQPATAERGYHRKRPRAASDSSIIAPQRRADDRGKASDHLGNPGSHRHVNLPVSRQGSPSRHDPRSSIAETKCVTSRDRQAPAKPYAKRTRHKTKTDRYEPKARKDREKTQHAGHVDPKPRRKRERPHRGGDGKRTEGLVQGFKLKNGPKNSRLTVTFFLPYGS